MKALKKTNAARILESLHIAYQLHTYVVDEEDLSAVHVAATMGQNIEVLFKTIVLRGDKIGPLVAVIPGHREVDLKSIAKISNNKSVEVIHMKDLLSLTGYIRGGCSPLGMKKAFPTYLDSSALGKKTIYVSAGKRGLQLELSPDDLIKATAAEVGDLCS